MSIFFNYEFQNLFNSCFSPQAEILIPSPIHINLYYLHYFFLINKKILLKVKTHYTTLLRGRQNRTKRTEKSNIRHGKRLYAEGGKRPYIEDGKIEQEKKKANNIIYNRNIPTTTKTTTNNPKYIISNSTKLDPNPIDFKNNHRNQCLETLDPCIICIIVNVKSTSN